VLLVAVWQKMRMGAEIILFLFVYYDKQCNITQQFTIIDILK